MQIIAENFGFFDSLIRQSKRILILVRKNPDVDTMAAALFLENVLDNFGKNIQIVAKGELPKFFKPHYHKVADRIETKKLIVSFNWHKVGVEKVGYKLDGEDFNFIITPINKSIEKDEVKIFHKGEEVDLIFTIGITSLNDLESPEGEYLENKEIVNIDKNPNNQLFGKLNFVDEDADSICGVTGALIEKSKIRPTTSAADLLLSGLRASTNDFNIVRDPKTFEVAAFCSKIKMDLISDQELPGQEHKEGPQVPKEWLSPKVYRSKQSAS
ncbi:hypothetical protein IH981_00710 [Patescibacteria group bacterium]|nr:hypothetical protein [Patescibacteria group bacterium]